MLRLQSLESLQDCWAEEVVSVCPADPDIRHSPVLSSLHLDDDTRHPQLALGGLHNLEGAPLQPGLAYGSADTD